MTSSSVIEVNNLRKTFGGIVAVDGATFSVEEASITGLIGPNGAGKTTTFNMISGFYEPDGGEILFRGTNTQEIMTPSSLEQIIWLSSSGVALGTVGLGLVAASGGSFSVMGLGAFLGAGLGAGMYLGQREWKSYSDNYRRTRPFQLSKSGLVRTFQITRELQGMTVLENLMLAPKRQSGESLINAWFRRDAVAQEERKVRERAEEMADFLEIDHLADEYAGSLSGGQRKLLELGRVLMTEPDVILLDEPVAGVNPTLTRKLLSQIENLREEGYTFLVVEHDMEVIMDISDTIIVMSEGKVLTEGTPEEIQEDERVIDAYLGG